MTSMRENPIRRQSRDRPPWLVPALAVVAVLVVVGLLYAVVAMVRGGGSPAAEETTTPQPCVTKTVVPADVLPKPAKVAVNVYNASAVSGLAGRTAAELRRRGFKIVKVANDPPGKKIAGVGEIRFGPKARARAEVLAAYVPAATLVPLSRSGLKVDLAMGDGFTGIAPQADVDAALTTPSPVTTGPGCASTSD